MIEWKDAKEVLPHSTKNVVMLDNRKDLIIGDYCNKENVFYALNGDEYAVNEITHWDYFEYPDV